MVFKRSITCVFEFRSDKIIKKLNNDRKFNCLNQSILMTFVSQFNTKADILMNRLRNLADGGTLVYLLKEFNHATLDAIAQVTNIMKRKLNGLPN